MTSDPGSGGAASDAPADPIELDAPTLRAVARAGADIDALCSIVLDVLGRRPGLAVHVLVLSPSGADGTIAGQARAGEVKQPDARRHSVSISKTAIERAVRSSGTVSVVIGRDALMTPELERFLSVVGAPLDGPVAATPLVADDQVVGVLRVSAPAGHPPFSAAECRVLDVLAASIAVPVGYRRAAGRIEVIVGAGLALGVIGDLDPSAPAIDELFDVAAAEVRSGAAADWAAVYEFGPDSIAVLRAAAGTDLPVSTSVHVSGADLDAHAAGTTQRWVGRPEDAAGFASVVPGTGSTMSVLLRGATGRFGLLVAGRAGICRFATGDTRFMAAAAHLVDKLLVARAFVEELRREATTDDLTGLPNRAELRRRLSAMVEHSDATNRPAVLLIADLDGFKVVNDSLGHAAGDDLLKVVAARLRAHVRPGDLVARLGGDEFAVLCSDMSEHGAVALAGRMLDALREPVDIGTARIGPRVSIGVAVYEPGSDHASDHELLSKADLAMYRAKAAGRDRVAVYDVALHEEVQRQLDLEQGLRVAITDGQLFLEYQPIVRLSDDAVVSFEALVRWRHPVLGLVRPDHFIHVAEEAGIITDLDLWVLRTASRQVVAWRDEGLLAGRMTVAVNVSARDLINADFAARFRDELAVIGCPPSWMVVEVTESLITDAAGAANVRSLRDYGVGIALDDYGTGFSSLAQLKRVPVDVVKVDRAFVAGLTTDAMDAAIVASTINLAHALGKEVVAEGVETIEQVDQLRRLGCDRVQGYLYARPMSADDLGARLRGAWSWSSEHPSTG